MLLEIAHSVATLWPTRRQQLNTSVQYRSHYCSYLLIKAYLDEMRIGGCMTAPEVKSVGDQAAVWDEGLQRVPRSWTRRWSIIP